MSSELKANPWDWLLPHDIKRFGEEILNLEERKRWCRATLICGLPYMWRYKAAAFTDRMYAKLELRPGDKVLLIGESNETCGFEDEIRRRIGPQGELVSIDIMEKARTASGSLVRDKNGRIGTWRYDYTSQYPDGYFDCVAVLQAIQHTDDWHESGRELLRVMKSGRVILLAELVIGPKTRTIAEQDLHLEYWMDKLYYGTGRTGPEDVSYYSPEELLAAFDGLVKDPGTLAWRGIELFWGTKL